MPKPLTLEQKLDRFPPVAIRLLARAPKPGGGVRALTDAEISAGSGLPVPDVARISTFTSWDAVPVAAMRAFLRGCGAQLDDRDWLRKNAAYMSNINSIPRYLQASDQWPYFERLMSIWLKAS